MNLFARTQGRAGAGTDHSEINVGDNAGQDRDYGGASLLDDRAEAAARGTLHLRAWEREARKQAKARLELKTLMTIQWSDVSIRRAKTSPPAFPTPHKQERERATCDEGRA